MTEQTQRGRPHLDLAIRLRNWGWYWLIKEESNLSDDRLDAKYVGMKRFERARLFFQVRSVGSSPTELRGRRKKGSVYELVHKNGQFARAKEWFESPLWWLLTTPSLEREDFTQFLLAEIGKRNWFRATKDEIGAGMWVFEGEEEPAFGSGWTQGHVAMADHLECNEGVNGVAILCALFREAYYDFQLELAQELRGKIEDALHSLVTSIPIPILLKKCMMDLVTDRVVKDLWISESDMPKTAEYQKLPRVRQIERFISCYISSESAFRSYRHGDHPIVLDTPRTQWFRRNKPKLLKLWARAKPINSGHLEDALDSFKGRTRAELAKFQRRINRIGKRMEYDPTRDERARADLQKLEAIPTKVKARCLLTS